MTIEIISKREGFHRCGIAHSIEPATYPDDRFSPGELKRLQEEPMLMVRTVEESSEKEPPAGPKVTREHLETKTKKELVAMAEETGLAEYLAEKGLCEPGELIKRKKSELIDLFLDDIEIPGPGGLR